jgi:hypothetical protein
MQEELPSVEDLEEVVNKLRSEMETLRGNAPMRNKAIHINGKPTDCQARPILRSIERSAGNEHLSDSSRTAIRRAVFCSHPGSGQVAKDGSGVGANPSTPSATTPSPSMICLPSVPADLSPVPCLWSTGRRWITFSIHYQRTVIRDTKVG